MTGTIDYEAKYKALIERVVEFVSDLEECKRTRLRKYEKVDKENLAAESYLLGLCDAYENTASMGRWEFAEFLDKD